MDKIIIITGGAGGIGSDICRGLAADGFKVVVADYAKDAAEKTAAEIRNVKGDATAVEVDVGSKESVAEMMKQALAKYGQVDILFNGAGVMTRIPVIDMPEEEWDRVLRINLKGTFLCSQAAAKQMIPRKQGRILSIASGRGVAGQARASHYAASKAGIIAFTKSLAVELAPYEHHCQRHLPRRHRYADVPSGVDGRRIQKKRGNPSVTGWVNEKRRNRRPDSLPTLRCDQVRYRTDLFPAHAEIAAASTKFRVVGAGFKPAPTRLPRAWELVLGF